MRITVFTPTYNRAYSLPRLFESLKNQTFHDFEWVIVNDGSIDNTDDVVNDFLLDKHLFTIKYKKIENGGKHRAINRGMEMVEGELFFIVDSDDWLPSDSLYLIDKTVKSISIDDKNMFAGVCGLKSFSNGELVGNTFKGEYLDITTLEKGIHHICRDRSEVYFTTLLKKYPFPEIEGEKFLTESIVWDRISHDGYKLRYFNKNIYMCEYLEDGLTKKGWKLYADNPIQWGMSIAQSRRFAKPSFYSLSIQYYKYFLLENENYSLRNMSKMLETGVLQFASLVCFQKVCDCMRYVLKKKTIRQCL